MAASTADRYGPSIILSPFLQGPASLPARFSCAPSLFVKSKAQKKELERQRAKVLQAQREKRLALSLKQKPDPILGYSTSLPEDHLKWENSELRRLILKNDEVWSGKVDEKTIGGSDENLLNFCLTEEQRELLFEALPAVTSQKSALEATTFEEVEHRRQEKVDEEVEVKKRALSRILSLRNANAKGIEKLNKLRILKAFSPPPKPGEPQKLDPGCSEVQAALTTYKIHSALEHAWENSHDFVSRRYLTSLVNLRMKILKYLRRTQPTRYHELLQRIGLDHRYLQEEIVVRSKLPPRPGKVLG
ncbi:hypothetical protein BY996DRAFT_4575802 [Phakopsora pachyrhizi]|uniref:Ribosomal protein S15 n=1 Tax=Phakopsora pachyrhizi TaxID=170000 RepID=A0AAV0BI88_PHAPC|nr:hypothetical protein BY996DRAFT_4575802 [Phakopsora pachyrhizi]CAH7686271.1 hypothetical protein PPACK8108_LOCUS20897 [Phakopsora pachyrhizi]